MKRRERGVTLTDLQRTCCHPDCHAEPIPESPVPLCVGHLGAVVRYFHDEVRTRHGFDWGSGINPAAQPPEPILREQPRRPAGESVVYFLRLADRVKIGTTANLPRRLTEIPHDEVLRVIPGGDDIERLYHQDFARWRIKGEWFAATDECLAAVAAIG